MPLPFVAFLVLQCYAAALAATSTTTTTPTNQATNSFVPGHAYHYLFRHSTTAKGSTDHGQKSPTHTTKVNAKGTITAVAPTSNKDEPASFAQVVLCRFDVTAASLVLVQKNHKTGQSKVEEDHLFQQALTSSPVHFVQNASGAIISLVHKDGEEAWVVNMKRSFIASLQVTIDIDNLQSATLPKTTVGMDANSATKKNSTLSLILQETDVSGTCNMKYQYQVHPSTQRIHRVSKTKSSRYDCPENKRLHASQSQHYQSTVTIGSHHNELPESTFQGSFVLHDKHGIVKRANLKEETGDENLGSHATGSSRLLSITTTQQNGHLERERAAADALQLQKNGTMHSNGQQRRRRRRIVLFRRCLREHYENHDRLISGFETDLRGARHTTLTFEHGDIIGRGDLSLNKAAHLHHGRPRLVTAKGQNLHWRRKLTVLLSKKKEQRKKPAAIESTTSKESRRPHQLPLDLAALVPTLDQDPFNKTLFQALKSTFDRADFWTNDENHDAASSPSTFSPMAFLQLSELGGRIALQKKLQELRDIIEECKEEDDKKDTTGTIEQWRPNVRTLKDAIAIAVPGSALDLALCELVWRSTMSLLEEMSSSRAQQRFRNAVIDALGMVRTPASQHVLLHVVHATTSISEERQRAVYTLLQSQVPSDDTVISVARIADRCQIPIAGNPEDVEQRLECWRALHVLGSLVHRHSLHHCLYSEQGYCEEDEDNRMDKEEQVDQNRPSYMRPYVGKILHNVARRLQTTSASSVLSSTTRKREIMSLLVCLGNAGSSDHIDLIIDHIHGGHGDVRDAAIEALHRMDHPKVEPTLWGFVDHVKTDRPGRLRALRTILDRDTQHFHRNLKLPSTHGNGVEATKRRNLKNQQTFSDILTSYIHGTFEPHQEEIEQLIELHLKKHQSRFSIDDNDSLHQLARQKITERSLKKGKNRKRPGMKWKRTSASPTSQQQSREQQQESGEGGKEKEQQQQQSVSSTPASKHQHGRDLGFVKSLGFSFRDGLSGEIGFYEHKTIFELGNEKFGAHAFVTTDDIAFLNIPLLNPKISFGVRVHNEAVIAVWADILVIKINYDIFRAEYSYIKTQEISLGDFNLIPDLPGGCPNSEGPTDTPGSNGGNRRQLTPRERVIGKLLPPSFGGGGGHDERHSQQNSASDSNTRRKLNGDADGAIGVSTNGDSGTGGTMDNLPDLSPWRDILSFRPSEALQTAMDKEKIFPQRIEEGLERVALDYYAIKITDTNYPLTCTVSDNYHMCLLLHIRGQDPAVFPFLGSDSQVGSFSAAENGFGANGAWFKDPPDLTVANASESGPQGLLGAKISFLHEAKCGKTPTDCDSGFYAVTKIVEETDRSYMILTSINDDGNYNSASGNRELGVKKEGNEYFVYTRGTYRVSARTIADVDLSGDDDDNDGDDNDGNDGSGSQRRRLLKSELHQYDQYGFIKSRTSTKKMEAKTKNTGKKTRSLFHGVTLPLTSTFAPVGPVTSAVDNEEFPNDDDDLEMKEEEEKGNDDESDEASQNQDQEESNQEPNNFRASHDEEHFRKLLSETGFVQGENSFGKPFVHHKEIAPGHFRHYSNHSHPLHGERMVYYESKHSETVVSLDKLEDEASKNGLGRLIETVRCSDGGHMEIVLLNIQGVEDISPSLRGLEEDFVILSVARWPECKRHTAESSDVGNDEFDPAAMYHFQRTGTPRAAKKSKYDKRQEADRKNRERTENSALGRLILNEPQIVFEKDGPNTATIILKTRRAKLTEVFQSLDLHVFGSKVPEHVQRRRMKTMRKAQKKRKKKYRRNLFTEANLIFSEKYSGGFNGKRRFFFICIDG
jgi:hypothetical protein